MGVLSNLEPAKVFHYFEEICSIPHGSYHEKEISDYLVSFARKHEFTVYQDALYNVIMLVPASAGYEREKPLILQGHMDMVCEKDSDVRIDMERDGLMLEIDGDYISAKGTTLGGDDGIAVAYMLAIAEDKEIAHPPLEMVFTVSEEVGMEGAAGIDLSVLKGHRMLNLDSEEEGIFLSSCAGGMSTYSRLPVNREQSPAVSWYELTVSGLLGGHSGCEIDKGRANANKILSRVLYELRKTASFYIDTLEGGKKDNAIPVRATAILGMEETAHAKERIKQLQSELTAEYAKSDGDIKIELCQAEDECSSRSVLDADSLSRVLALLMALPDGVQEMSMSVPGLVETSLNLGILKLEEDYLFLQHSIRSSVSTRKNYVASRVEALVTALGGTVEIKGEYPAWEYRENSVVREKVSRLYKRMYGKEPVIQGIHAGLECGLLAGKIKDLDCVSMGPDILDIHTTAERLSISSVKRVYEFLLAYMEEKEETPCV